MTRLETISVSVAALFARATEVKQREVVDLACRRAVSEVNLAGYEIDLALELIKTGDRDVGLQDKLKAIADEFDEVYFDMTDDADESQAPFDSEGLTDAADMNFRKSRAAQALAYAVSGDRNDLPEALYEALHALADQADVIQIAERKMAST